jgi:hypothetical protein
MTLRAENFEVSWGDRRIEFLTSKSFSKTERFEDTHSTLVRPFTFLSIIIYLFSQVLTAILI